MDLEADGRARRDLLGDAGIPDAGNAARRIAGQEIANAGVATQVRRDFVGVVVNRLVWFHADQIAVAIEGAVLQRHFQRLVPLLFWVFCHVVSSSRVNYVDEVMNAYTVVRVS